MRLNRYERTPKPLLTTLLIITVFASLGIALLVSVFAWSERENATARRAEQQAALERLEQFYQAELTQERKGRDEERAAWLNERHALLERICWQNRAGTFDTGKAATAPLAQNGKMSPKSFLNRRLSAAREELLHENSFALRETDMVETLLRRATIEEQAAITTRLLELKHDEGARRDYLIRLLARQPLEPGVVTHNDNAGVVLNALPPE